MKSYKELEVYQKSMQLVIDVYAATKLFPKSEIFGLSSQLNRAIVSIPSNIAEGFNRRTSKDYLQFLQIAYGSSAEVDTQITIAATLGYIGKDNYKKLQDQLIIIQKMLHKLIIAINEKISNH